MATFATHVGKETNKRKRSPSLAIEDEETVSVALCQFNSKQDVRPDYLESRTHMALMAGDGHSGDKTASCLSENSQMILQEMLGNSIEAAMQLCQDLCRDFDDGAMLVLCLYEFATRIVRILSVGDASCNIYQKNVLVHQQPHQDGEWFFEKFGTAHESGLNIAGEEYGEIYLERNENGDIKRYGTLKPKADGKHMGFPRQPAYANFRVGNMVFSDKYASGAFVGHKGYPRLPPLITEFTVDPGPFHIVMTSDGVSDVMHPEDPLLQQHDVTAVEIMEECKRRWTSEWSVNGRQMKLLNTPTVIKSQGRDVQKAERNARGNYRVTFRDGEQRTVAQIEETNRGADDISVIVYAVHEEEPAKKTGCSHCGCHVGLAQHLCSADSFVFVTDLARASRDIQEIAQTLDHFATRQGVSINDDRQYIMENTIPGELKDELKIVNATYIFEVRLMYEDDFIEALHDKGYKTTEVFENIFSVRFG